jgi:hypothetical protein
LSHPWRRPPEKAAFLVLQPTGLVKQSQAIDLQRLESILYSPKPVDFDVFYAITQGLSRHYHNTYRRLPAMF